MCKNATELATDEDFDLSEMWLKKFTNSLKDLINDPYKVLSDQLDADASVSKGVTNPIPNQDCEGKYMNQGQD